MIKNDCNHDHDHFQEKEIIKKEEKKGTLTRLIVLHSEMNHALNVVAHVGNHGVIPSFKSFFVWRVVDILPLFTL